MKAQSPISIHVQEPVKILGMPPLHAALVLFAMMFAIMCAGTLFGQTVGFGLGLFGAPLAIAYIVLLRRREPHCEALLLHPTAFFRGGTFRPLVAGTPICLKKKRKP